MKKFWAQNGLLKTIVLLFSLALILTWIIPVGNIEGTEFVKSDMVRIGLADLGNIAYFMFAFSIDKILFLLALGAFYGVLLKTDAYHVFVGRIVAKLKGKEIFFTVLVSIFLAILTSLSISTYAVLVLVPLFINLILGLKLDKLTAFCATFGSILVGTLGATLGTDGFYWFNYYISHQAALNFVSIGLVYRVLILVIAILLFNFFTIMHIKKIKNTKVKINDSDLFEIMVPKRKKIKTFPIVIIFVVLTLVTILGFIDWAGNFKIEIFNQAFNWLTNLTIGKKFKLMAAILGTSAAPFGNQLETYPVFNIYLMISLLIILTGLLIIIYRFNFAKISTAISIGFQKMSKVILTLFLVSSVGVVFYLTPMILNLTNKVMPIEGKPDVNLDYHNSGVAYFNKDIDNDGKPEVNLINQDTDKDGKCDLNCDTDGNGWPDKFLDFNGNGELDTEDKKIQHTFKEESILNNDTNNDGIADLNIDTDYNIAANVLAAGLASFFHGDLMVVGNLLSSYLLNFFGAHFNVVFLIYVTVFGLVAFLAPTSSILAVGLSYTEIEYQTWLKYIWQFVTGIFVCLLLIYILLLYL